MVVIILLILFVLLVIFSCLKVASDVLGDLAHAPEYHAGGIGVLIGAQKGNVERMMRGR